MVIRLCKKEEVDRCVDLHMESLKEGLLFLLGRDFLRLAYNIALNDTDSFIIVNEEDNRINGVAVGTRDTEAFTSKISKMHFLKIGLRIAGMVLKKPSIFTTVLDALSKSKGTPAELVYLFVSTNNQNKGIGKRLLEKTEERFRQWGIRSYKITVNRTNPNAVRFYEKNGFQRLRNQSIFNKKRVYEKRI